ncbi:hypothetical protein HUT16_18745 [Kitasatospora sp. NA04385]|uniref:hypothetical protein n=1 Tax=Kitasatospora sp. NA04385 TaxID=2742135 RepID=UPI00159132E8|nr:hypothetical protein [Kitasatospora sp. NA04385]QKW20829.1 hypothetical protein HUT16_18745 [Kitasatospora sp. NA04385]
MVVGDMRGKGCRVPHADSPLGAGGVLRRFLREGFADVEGAAELLERAFRMARLEPPPGLSPVYRPDVAPELAGVALGCAGLGWVQRLAESLLELAFLRGELHAVVAAFPELDFGDLSGEYLEVLGVIAPDGALPKLGAAS